MPRVCSPDHRLSIRHRTDKRTEKGEGATHVAQHATKTVANLYPAANGAISIAPANIKCPQTHPVNRSGLALRNRDARRATLLGGRGVKPASSGERTRSGRRVELARLMMEKMTSEVLPMRPIWLRASLELRSEAGTS